MANDASDNATKGSVSLITMAETYPGHILSCAREPTAPKGWLT